MTHLKMISQRESKSLSQKLLKQPKISNDLNLSLETKELQELSKSRKINISEMKALIIKDPSTTLTSIQTPLRNKEKKYSERNTNSRNTKTKNLILNSSQQQARSQMTQRQSQKKLKRLKNGAKILSSIGHLKNLRTSSILKRTSNDCSN